MTMDLLNELENLASEAVRYDEKPTTEQVNRWQKLFGYTEAEALEQINAHRLDLNHRKISDEQWDLIQVDKEAEGYDREAYEHKLQLLIATGTQQPVISEDTDTFIFKLGGPLQNLENLKSAIGSQTRILEGSNEDGGALFVKVNGATKRKIEQWLVSHEFRDYQPRFIRLSMARKDLSNDSLYPTLGVESTLPHCRAQHQSEIVMQNDYPVWYFFYGTLGQADLIKLQDLLDLEYLPELRPATVEGGRVEMWGGKYRALVDGPPESVVQGWAYEVETFEHEEALRCYETENYEVVRCVIIVGDGQRIGGLTFRFANPGLVDDATDAE
ncbi:MAG: hypothetical protein Q9166_006156 [cf. Caloplaca sp. 2 TL-2023]